MAERRKRTSRGQTQQRRASLRRKAEQAVDDLRFHSDPRVAATELKRIADEKNAKANPPVAEAPEEGER